MEIVMIFLKQWEDRQGKKKKKVKINIIYLWQVSFQILVTTIFGWTDSQGQTKTTTRNLQERERERNG